MERTLHGSPEERYRHLELPSSMAVTRNGEQQALFMLVPKAPKASALNTAGVLLLIRLGDRLYGGQANHYG